MKNKQISQKDEAMKELLRGIKVPPVRDRAIKSFMSKLEAEPARKEVLTPSQVWDAARYRALDILDSIQAVAARPFYAYSAAPAFARVAALLFVFVSIYSYAYTPQAPMLHNIEGTVKIYDPSKNEWTFAANNQRLKKDFIVKTFDDGRADISLGDSYSMRMKRDSEVKVGQLSSRAGTKSVQFDVSKGKILAYYSKNNSKTAKGFEVRTEESIASVIGTNFAVETMPDLHKTWVGVLDGIVSVRSIGLPKGEKIAGATVYVKSKFDTEIDAGSVPTAPQMMAEDRWYQLQELYSVGKKPQVAILISSGSTRTRELLSVAPLYISDKKPSIFPASIDKIARDFENAAKGGSTKIHLENIRELEKILKEHPNPVYDVTLLLFIGAYYEFLDYHEKAIETFRQVLDRYPRSHLASLAQCAIGIIYEEKLKDKKDARQAYLTILSKYPNTPEIDEAIAGLKRLSI